MAISKIDPDGLNIGQIGGRRNLIINGAMQVAQRGTSAAISSTATFVVDRFSSADSLMDQIAATLSQSTDAPDGFATSLKVTVDTAETTLASNEQLLLEQRIEAQNLQHLQYGTSDAKQITLSFWVKCSETGVGTVMFYQEDDNRSYSAQYTVSSADTWEYKTITVSGDTVGVIDNNNGAGLYVRWHLAAGSNFTSGTKETWATYLAADVAVGQTIDISTTEDATWQITGVQLEVGDVATPFEHRSYGEELALCQRYYAKVRTGWSGDATNNETYVAYYQNPVEMRSAPTTSWVNIAQASFNSAHTAYQISKYGGGVYRQANSTNSGRLFVSDGTLDAEL